MPDKPDGPEGLQPDPQTDAPLARPQRRRNAQPPWFTETNALDLPGGYTWTPQEHWAWARIIRGMPADMSWYPGPQAQGQTFKAWLDGRYDGAGQNPHERKAGATPAGAPDETNADPNAKPPKQPFKTWPAHRRLSDTFLRLILFQSPWRDVRARSRLQIYSAEIVDTLEWATETFSGDLWFYNCRFMADVNWQDLHVSGLLLLNGSHFVGNFEADRLKTSALYCLEGIVAEKNFSVSGAVIRGDAHFKDAHFEGAFFGGSMVISDTFGFNDVVVEGDTNLLAFRIEGDAAFDNALLKGPVELSVAQIGRNLYLRNMRRLGNVGLVAINVGGHVQLRQSVIEGEVDLTAAVINGELHLAKDAEKPGPTWRGGRLVLRNASVGALGGGIDSFPKTSKGQAKPPMELAGFTYKRLGGLGAGNTDAGPKDEAPAKPEKKKQIEKKARIGTLAEASIGELKEWLKSGHEVKRFTPDPYRQLSIALAEGGHAAKANEVLHAMRLHERHCEKNPFRRLRLWASGVTIGFGYRNDYAVIWFGLIVVAFAAIGLGWQGLRHFDPSLEGIAQVGRWLGFSFGNSIPLVTLDKAHETFLAARFVDPATCMEAARAADACTPDKLVQYVPVGLSWVFYAQKVLGFIVLSFLAAGLSGAATRQKS